MGAWFYTFDCGIGEMEACAGRTEWWAQPGWSDAWQARVPTAILLASFVIFLVALRANWRPVLEPVGWWVFGIGCAVAFGTWALAG